MDFCIEIYIPPSRSVVYREVIAKAKQTGFYNEDTRKLTFTSIEEVWRWWENFSFVVWQAQKWVGFLVIHNGRMLLPYTNKYYYDLQDVQRCYFTFQKTPYKSTFCNDGCFGCHRLKSILREITAYVRNYQMWYSYGRFISPNIWEIDKNAIAAQLMQEATENFAKNCPEFWEHRITESVNQLPDKIEVNDFWIIDYKTIFGVNGPERIPIGIRPNYDDTKDQPITPRNALIIGQVNIAKIPDEIEDSGITENSNTTDETEIDRINSFLDGLLKKKKKD